MGPDGPIAPDKHLDPFQFGTGAGEDAAAPSWQIAQPDNINRIDIRSTFDSRDISNASSCLLAPTATDGHPANWIAGQLSNCSPRSIGRCTLIEC